MRPNHYPCLVGPLVQRDETMKQNSLAAEEARGIVEKTKSETLVFLPSGKTSRVAGAEQMAKLVGEGIARRATPKEIRAYLEENECGDYLWWISTIEAAQGGLAALRSLVEYADGQDSLNLGDELAPHFDAIGAALKAARDAYKANLKTMRKAIA